MPSTKRIYLPFLAIFALVVSGCAELKSKVEPPIRVTLSSYIFTNGYYVIINNTHDTVILEGVNIEYTDAQGQTKIQSVGVVRPKEAKQLDPNDVNWRVERGEKIAISANGYLTRTIQVNSLLD